MTITAGARALLTGALALALIACNGGDADPTTTSTFAPAATAPPVESAPVTASPDTASPTEPTSASTVPAPSGWQQVIPGGDCRCADGSEFSFWVRQADPDKVVLFLQGGGACFNAETCSFTNGTYKVTTDARDDPSDAAGIFDFADPRNPLADWSFVFVPYCTGDVHIGDAVTEYAPGLSVNHVGSVNVGAALDHLVTTFPGASDVLVTGESAGSVPTPLYAGLVSDRLPDADIDVLADGSGAYPDVPAINALLGSLWGTANAIPPWPENAGLTAETWSFPGLFIQAGHHDPAITFARHDYAYDRAQGFFASLAGIAVDDLVTLIDGNETQIEAAGVPLASYIAPGSAHTVLGSTNFYGEQVEGVALVDWVTQLVDEQPVADVHCTECQGG